MKRNRDKKILIFHWISLLKNKTDHHSLKRGQRVQYKVGPAPDGALTGKGELGMKKIFMSNKRRIMCIYFYPIRSPSILYSYIITSNAHNSV